MKDYQQRVLDEKKDLDVRRVKLLEFIQSATFIQLPTEEAHLLIKQLQMMTKYSEILAQRIEKFG